VRVFSIVEGYRFSPADPTSAPTGEALRTDPQ
jgi:hypothetical protein